MTDTTDRLRAALSALQELAAEQKAAIMRQPRRLAHGVSKRGVDMVLLEYDGRQDWVPDFYPASQRLAEAAQLRPRASANFAKLWAVAHIPGGAQLEWKRQHTAAAPAEREVISEARWRRITTAGLLAGVDRSLAE